MLHASTRKLIDRLSEMTELGKLDWTETEDGTLAYATEGYSVTLTETPNEVIITSKTGKELERASAEELATTQQDDGVAYTSVVAAMTMEASRIARGTEAAISSLLADLQDAPEADPTIEETDADENLVEDPVNETTAIVSEPVAPIEPEPEPEPEIAAETVIETTASTAGEASSEDASEPHPAEIEVAAVEEETGTSSDAEPVAFSEPEAIAEIDTAADEPLDPEPESAAETETESDVTEAVARLAKEVNQRQDTGLDAAAASAVGAVALAAGLTAHSGPEEDTSDSGEVVDETSAEIVAAEPAAVPAYIPFGLGADSEPEVEADEETEIVAAPEVTTDDVQPAEDNDSPVEITAASPFAFTPSAQPDPEPAPAETMWQSAETVAEAEAETEIEPVAEVTADAAPETPFQIAAEPSEETVSDFSISAPAFGAVTDTITGAPELVADAVNDEPDGMVTVAETEDVVEAKAPDAVAPEPEAAPEPAVTEPEPPKTYSLSGIGAGFGLGALSAKTEASGIPSARPSNTPAPEKVIIDATDDVLPELEGNLNVSLAETASAAVSAASSESVAAADPSEPEKDTETDILKPGTRFNPWD